MRMRAHVDVHVHAATAGRLAGFVPAPRIIKEQTRRILYDE